MDKQLEFLISKLQLIPHPEGGFYREIFRSEETVQDGERNLMTSIYFLLTSENISRFHRIKSDELWFHHAGSPLIVHILDAAGYHQHLVGDQLENGMEPQFLVPKNTVFGSTVLEKNSYSLVSCVVAPGFDFADFEMAKRDRLIEGFPKHKEIIISLTR